MSEAKKRRGEKGTGPGMPAYLHLKLFASVVEDCFSETLWLCGSAARGKVWRDIDVRIVLPDDKFEQWCGRASRPYHSSPRWSALCMAFAALGKQMTGLPIDFQIISETDHDEFYSGQPREFLALRVEDRQ